MQFGLTAISASLTLLASVTAAGQLDQADLTTRQVNLIARGGVEVSNDMAREYFNDKAKEDNDDENSQDDEVVVPAYYSPTSSTTLSMPSATKTHKTPFEAIKDKVTGKDDSNTDAAMSMPMASMGIFSAAAAGSLFVLVL